MVVIDESGDWDDQTSSKCYTDKNRLFVDSVFFADTPQFPLV